MTADYQGPFDDPVVEQVLENEWLREQGMYFTLDDLKKVKVRCLNCSLPEGTVGGARGN